MIFDLVSKLQLKKEMDYGEATGATSHIDISTTSKGTTSIILKAITAINRIKLAGLLSIHDRAINLITQALTTGRVFEEVKGSSYNIPSQGGYDFTVNVYKEGYTCISASIKSTSNYDVVVVGGGLTGPNTFTGTVRNISGAGKSVTPLIACTYIPIA